MTDQSHPAEDRLQDLLATYAVQELTPTEHAELTALLAEVDGVTAEEFETAAAAMHLAMTQTNESLPDGLADKVLSDATDFFEERTPLPQGQSAPARPVSPASTVRSSGIRMRELLAWATAAIAIVFAVMKPPTVIELPDPQPRPAPMSIAESRDLLLEDADTIKRDWQATPDPTAANASGEIVWNTKKQQGFMRIADLEKNDPTKSQYQLWIFDTDQEHPIDGGVFDITDGEQLIPIDPKIAASEVFQFAVTIEKPGGVVVSKKERIPLLAVVTL